LKTNADSDAGLAFFGLILPILTRQDNEMLAALELEVNFF
jgi:hypothetical protein